MRAKTNDFPRYMSADVQRRGFIVRNPVNGSKRRFADEALARAAAEELNRSIASAPPERRRGKRPPTLGLLVERWIADELAHRPWQASTRRGREFMLARIQRELGDRPVASIDGLELKRWLDAMHLRPNNWNCWRLLFSHLWRYAVLHRLGALANEAEKIPMRSQSKVLAINRKLREPLTLDDFRAIHAQAEPWLQLAMELSLLTCQARTEVLRMRHGDFRDGYLYVIRQKVAARSEMGFIRIAVTRELEDLRRRARCLAQDRHLHQYQQALELYEQGVGRQEIARRLGIRPRARTDPRHRLDAGQLVTQLICYALRQRARYPSVPLASPYLVHRAPARARRGAVEAKPHWTAIAPGYLSRAFAYARDATGRWSGRRPAERPSFHEIRGLSARLAQERGIERGAIQRLMTHVSSRTTAIYLERGAGALRDEHYVPVQTLISLREILRAPPC